MGFPNHYCKSKEMLNSKCYLKKCPHGVSHKCQVRMKFVGKGDEGGGSLGQSLSTNYMFMQCIKVDKEVESLSLSLFSNILCSNYSNLLPYTMGRGPSLKIHPLSIIIQVEVMNYHVLLHAILNNQMKQSLHEWKSKLKENML